MPNTRAIMDGWTPYKIYLDYTQKLSNGDTKHYFRIDKYNNNPACVIPITVSQHTMTELEIPTLATHKHIWDKGSKVWEEFTETKRQERIRIIHNLVQQIDREYQKHVKAV